MNYKVESGRRLKQVRESQGLTLQDVADQAKGYSVSRISNYEQGKRQMRQKEAVALAKVLSVSAAYLMCVDEASTLPPHQQRLLELYNAADNRGKRIIEQVAEAEARYAIKALPHTPAVASNA